jgi:hypothetical protein
MPDHHVFDRTGRTFSDQTHTTKPLVSSNLDYLHLAALRHLKVQYELPKKFSRTGRLCVHECKQTRTFEETPFAFVRN